MGYCVMEIDDAYDNVDLIQALNEQQQEIKRLNNIINELEKYLNEEKDIQGTNIENKIYYEVLDKLKELKEGK